MAKTPIHPNPRLKRAREQKGWTQEQLAGFIGTVAINISRWENGKIPSPHFRSLLCEIFEKTPQELGWFEDTLLSSPLPLVPVPMVQEQRIQWPATIPDETYYPLPGREKEIQHLLTLLQDPNGPSLLTIDGLGGQGKTALAVELSRRALQQELFDGLVGESAKQEVIIGSEIVQVNDAVLDFDTLLDAIIRQLGRWELLTLKPPEKRSAATQLLQQKKYLVLVDNLETVDNAYTLVSLLRSVLQESRAIVTSRKHVPYDFVYSCTLKQLTLEDALFFLQQDMLRNHNKQLEQASTEQFVEIYTVTGGAPLALKLVVAQTRFLDLNVILKQLRLAGSKLYPFIFYQSWQQLSPIAQKVLIYIGITAITTVTWEELTQVNIAPDGALLVEAIEQLVSYSLLDISSTLSPVRYGIHQLTRHFVHSDLPTIWREQGLL